MATTNKISIWDYINNLANVSYTPSKKAPTYNEINSKNINGLKVNGSYTDKKLVKETDLTYSSGRDNIYCTIINNTGGSIYYMLSLSFTATYGSKYKSFGAFEDEYNVYANQSRFKAIGCPSDLFMQDGASVYYIGDEYDGNLTCTMHVSCNENKYCQIEVKYGMIEDNAFSESSSWGTSSKLRCDFEGNDFSFKATGYAEWLETPALNFVLTFTN